MNSSTMAKSFSFKFYRFISKEDRKTTEIVKDCNLADGMKGLIDNTPQQLLSALTKVQDWAAKQGLGFSYADPYPSSKYPGKAWLDIRFNGLIL